MSADPGHMESLTWGAIALRLVGVAVLVLANAFFVAAEFALVASRRSRVDAMVKRGDRRSASVARAIDSLDRYISGTQLGITLASLGLGWIGEPAVAVLIERLFHGLPGPFAGIATHGVATVIAFLGITFLHIVFGELAPKALALLHPESTSRWVADPLMIFTRATNPFIWLLNGTANATLRVFRARAPGKHERVHSPEELMMLVDETRESGTINVQDARMIEGVLDFANRTVREVMTPRPDVLAIPAELTVSEASALVETSGWSRFPVYRDTLEDVAGIMHVKDLLVALRRDPDAPVDGILRPAFFLPSTRHVKDALADMRRRMEHIALVLDEFGGMAGLVTMEDLLEEIVGPIYDEYDRDEARADAASVEGTPVIAGSTELVDLNRTFGLALHDPHYTTIGGLIFGALGRLPEPGDRVLLDGARFDVVEMDGRRVGRVRMSLAQPNGGPSPGDPAA